MRLSFKGITGAVARRIYNPIFEAMAGIYQGTYAPTPDDYRLIYENSYLKNPYARRCMDLVVNSAASVPLDVQYNRGQKWTSAKDDDPLVKLLSRPQPGMSGQKFRKILYRNLIGTGEAYVYRLPTAGLSLKKGILPERLQPLRPDRMQTYPSTDGVNLVAYYTYMGSDGRERQIERQDILKITIDNPLDDFAGASPLRAAMKAIDMNNAAIEGNAAMMQNGNRSAGLWTYRGHLTPQAEAAIRKMSKAKYGGPGKWGEDMILGGDYKYEKIGLSPAEMEAVDLLLTSADMIAGVLGVPQQFVDPRASTYSNMQEAHLMLLMDTCFPLVEEVGGELGSYLGEIIGQEVRILPNREASYVVQQANQARYATMSQACGVPFLTPNQALEELGYEKSKTPAADQIWVSASLLPMDNAATAAETDSQAPPAGEAQRDPFEKPGEKPGQGEQDEAEEGQGEDAAKPGAR